MPAATSGNDTDTIAQPLRTVMKRSETTKLKALGRVEFMAAASAWESGRIGANTPEAKAQREENYEVTAPA